MQNHIHRKVRNLSVSLFEHIDTGIIGIDGKPFVNMEPYVDTSRFDQLHEEVLLAFSKIGPSNFPKVSGERPPQMRELEGCLPYEDNYLYSLDEEDLQVDFLSSMSKTQRRRYLFYSGKISLPWLFSLQLKRNNFYNKTKSSEVYPEWEPEVCHFPKLMSWLKTLPFSSIGRVVFFGTYPGVEVPIHRDGVVSSHRDHCINFFFDRSRPSYVYNCETKTKVYLPDKIRAYFFNNRDYHGVDAEPVFRYTLRVDGVFTDELINQLKLTEKGLIPCS